MSKRNLIAVLLCNQGDCRGDEKGCSNSKCGRGKKWRWWSRARFLRIFDREPRTEFPAQPAKPTK